MVTTLDYKPGEFAGSILGYIEHFQLVHSGCTMALGQPNVKQKGVPRSFLGDEGLKAVAYGHPVLISGVATSSLLARLQHVVFKEEPDNSGVAKPLFFSPTGYFTVKTS